MDVFLRMFCDTPRRHGDALCVVWSWVIGTFRQRYVFHLILFLFIAQPCRLLGMDWVLGVRQSRLVGCGVNVAFAV